MYQQSLLRSFSIVLKGAWLSNSRSNAWAAICARLPPKLVSIDFNVAGYLDVEDADGQWLIYTSGFYEVQRAATLVNRLGSCVRRCAPRAKMSLSDSKWNDGHSLYREQGVRVLDELEPWSDNWLEWWEDSTEIDLNGGEGASNVA